METVSGDDLTPFFQQWLYRGGVPRLAGTWSWDGSARTVTIDLRQTQPGPPFRLPVEVAIETAGVSPRVERIELTGASAHVVFPVEREPSGLVIDPAVRLLAAVDVTRR